LYFAELIEKKVDMRGYLESPLGMLRIAEEWQEYYYSSIRERKMLPVNIFSVGSIIDEFFQIE